MALPATRVELKIQLSHVPRGIEVARSLILARHPSETVERVALRALAWCVLYEDALEPGPGLCDGDAPDLLAKDARGDVTTWVACGNVTWEKARRALSQNPLARVVAFAEDRGARRDPAGLMDEIAALGKPPKGADRVEVWTVDPALVRGLASDARRQTWTVTVLDGHIYVDTGGARLGVLEGPLNVARPLP